MVASPLTYVRTDILEIAFTSFFYGLYLIVVMQSVYFLCRQGPFKTKGNTFMMCTTAIMFAAATGSWIEELIDVLLYLPYDLAPKAHVPASVIRKDNSLITANDVFVRVTYILSDAIVVWRAWLLWRDSLRAKLLLCFCMTATVVGAAIDVSFDLVERWHGKGISFRGIDAIIGRALILTIPTLFTNICATSLIAYQAWIHRREIKRDLSESDRRTTVEKVLALLVESGAFYCLIWVFYLIAAGGILPSPSDTIIREILIQIAAIYPSIIICIVCLSKSHCDRHFSYSVETSPRFALPPPRRRSGGAPAPGDTTIMSDDDDVSTDYRSSPVFPPGHSPGAHHIKTEDLVFEAKPPAEVDSFRHV